MNPNNWYVHTGSKSFFKVVGKTRWDVKIQYENGMEDKLTEDAVQNHCEKIPTECPSCGVEGDPVSGSEFVRCKNERCGREKFQVLYESVKL